MIWPKNYVTYYTNFIVSYNSISFLFNIKNIRTNLDNDNFINLEILIWNKKKSKLGYDSRIRIHVGYYKVASVISISCPYPSVDKIMPTTFTNFKRDVIKNNKLLERSGHDLNKKARYIYKIKSRLQNIRLLLQRGLKDDAQVFKLWSFWSSVNLSNFIEHYKLEIDWLSGPCNFRLK